MDPNGGENTYKAGSVFVNGKICMENGVIPDLDMAELRRQAQLSGDHVWSTVQDWDPKGRTAEEASPWSLPLHRH